MLPGMKRGFSPPLGLEQDSDGDRPSKWGRGAGAGAGARPSAAPRHAEEEERRPNRGNKLASPSRHSGEMGTGSIVRYDEGKGYGFIAPDEGGEDVFFLRAELPPELAHAVRREEMLHAHVEYEVHEKADGKLRARQMVMLSPPPLKSCEPPAPAPPVRSEGGSSRQAFGDAPPGARRVFGRVLRFDQNRGFGFIQSPEEQHDVFFLPSVLTKDLQDLCESGSVCGAEVEMEVVDKEEGKPRATWVVPAPDFASGPPRRNGYSGGGGGHAGGHGGSHHGHHHSHSRRDGPPHRGVFISFDPQKGIGFIKPQTLDEDVFYLRSEMPRELRDCDHRDQVVDRRVEFEVKTMPDGKMRAQRCVLLPPPRGGHPSEYDEERGGDGSRHRTGRIRRFDQQRGYGFIEVYGEQDIFFLPSALPRDLKDREGGLDGLEVNFAVFENESGRVRARGIQPSSEGGADGGFDVRRRRGGGVDGVPTPPPPPAVSCPPFGGGPPNGAWPGLPPLAVGPTSAGHLQHLDPALVDEMAEYLADLGGSIDFEEFSHNFPNAKRKQLEEHFDVSSLDGTLRIELPQGHPGHGQREDGPWRSHASSEPRGGESPPRTEGEAAGREEGGISAEEEGGREEEPAMDPSYGLSPKGRIRSYDCGKGFGFVVVDDLQDDVFFARPALPEAFHAKTRVDLPADLIGVEVAVELVESTDKGLRAARLHLLLRYHPGRRCWLLKRH